MTTLDNLYAGSYKHSIMTMIAKLTHRAYVENFKQKWCLNLLYRFTWKIQMELHKVSPPLQITERGTGRRGREGRREKWGGERKRDGDWESLTHWVTQSLVSHGYLRKPKWRSETLSLRSSRTCRWSQGGIVARRMLFFRAGFDPFFCILMLKTDNNTNHVVLEIDLRLRRRVRYKHFTSSAILLSTKHGLKYRHILSVR